MALVNSAKFKIGDLPKILKHGFRNNLMTHRFKKETMALSVAEYLPSLNIAFEKLHKYKNTNINSFLNKEVITPNNNRTQFHDHISEAQPIDFHIRDGAVIQGFNAKIKHAFKVHDLYSSVSTMQKYQSFFEPNNDISDLGFLNTIMPLAIKMSNYKRENLVLKYDVEANDLHCDTIVIDVGKNSKLDLTELIGDSGSHILNVFYILRENSSLTLNRNITNSNTYINSKVIQEPGSRFAMSCTTGDIDFSYQNIDVDSYHNCHTYIDNRNALTGDRINNFVVNINHLGRESFSNIDSKTIVDDNSINYFKGNIFIDKEAENINAHMLNKNLQISKKAKVYTEPTLDILNKEVVCSHGCTISNIDENELYYLQTKGLDKTQSINILKDAFLK